MALVRDINDEEGWSQETPPTIDELEMMNSSSIEVDYDIDEVLSEYIKYFSNSSIYNKVYGDKTLKECLKGLEESIFKKY